MAAALLGPVGPVLKLAWSAHRDKGSNDEEYVLMRERVDRVSDFLERYFPSDPAKQQQFSIQLAFVEKAVRAATEWMHKYSTKSVMKKFFKSGKLRGRRDRAKEMLDEALRMLQLEMGAAQFGQPVRSRSSDEVLLAEALREQHELLDAAKENSFAKVRQLVDETPALARKALVNAQPSGRWPVLHHAAKAGDAETVRFLLRHGAEPSAKNRDGHTAHDVTSALSAAHAECRSLLAEACAWHFELGELAVAQDVALHLRSYTEVGAPLRGSETSELMYEVVGPLAALHIIRQACGGERDQRCGFMTRTAPVTLPEAGRVEAGIPANAEHFAFVHPPMCEDKDETLMTTVSGAGMRVSSLMGNISRNRIKHTGPYWLETAPLILLIYSTFNTGHR